MKISIITPCFNAEQYIEETYVSIINQTAILKGRAELEYIVVDGGSSDNTIKILKSITSSNHLKIISEPDSGIYDALSKGIKLLTGDICAYINAGDYYHKCAFDIILDIFEKNNVKWLTGYNFIYSENSYAIPYSLPYIYRQRFFCRGIYGTILPCVQQESTFWSSSLNNQIDHEIFSKLKLAGDYYLWMQFSQVENLKMVDAYLGGFKKHSGQLSENKELYNEEIKKITQQPTILDIVIAYIDKVIFYFPSKLKKMLNKQGIFVFNHKQQEWI